MLNKTEIKFLNNTIDKYSKNRNTGSLILVDQATNETVAAGMVV